MIRAAHLKCRYDRVGGIETMLAAILPCFAAHDVAARLVYVSHQVHRGDGAALAGPGVPVDPIDWQSLRSAPAAAHALARTLDAHAIDVLHTHDMRADLLAALSAPLRRVPWVCHIHGWLGQTHKGVHRLYESIDRFLIRFADHVIVGSHAALDEVNACGARAASVAWNAVAIPPELDGAAAGITRCMLGLRRDTPLFAMLGRLHYGKGQDLFIEALARIADQAWHAVIVGEGETRSDLEALAQARGVAGRITFTGFVEDPTRYVAAADVMAVCSRKESLPLTALEGLAYAKAVVATATGDLPRVIRDGETGLIAPVEDAPALAAAFARLAADPDLRRRLGEAGRRAALANHSAEALALAIAQVDRNLAGRGRRA